MPNKRIRVAIIGNPNVGKTSIYNNIACKTENTGNWPGVTVSEKTSVIQYQGCDIEITDLPGIYSVNCQTEIPDERSVLNYLKKRSFDLIINAVDIANLERNLYLTIQLLEMEMPLLMVYTKSDMIEGQVDLEFLHSVLHAKYVSINAKSFEASLMLDKVLEIYANHEHAIIMDIYPDVMMQEIYKLQNEFSSNRPSKYEIISCLEGCNIFQNSSEDLLEKIEKSKEMMLQTLNEDLEMLITSVRYNFIRNICTQAIKKTVNTKMHIVDMIDNIVLNKMLSLPILFAVMFCIFSFSIFFGGTMQEYIASYGEEVTQYIKNFALASGVQHWLAHIIKTLLNGVVMLLSFTPILFLLYVSMAILEESGYMSRAAFVVDRFMQILGIPGKSFIPLIIGFGCNVPGIMATRILENPKDRVMVAMMMPFMSCSARLSVYSIFCLAFFGKYSSIVVLFLYIFGMLVALFTAVLCRRVLKHEDEPYFIMEFPSYHFPDLKHIAKRAGENTSQFLIRAGKLIIVIFLIIQVGISVDAYGNIVENAENSVMAKFGQYITPLFAPIGIEPHNWPAVVGIIAGILAKEVVIGTLAALYATTDGSLIEALQCHFVSKEAAFAYLLFILLYFPCSSTFIAIAKEMSWKVAVASLLWSVSLGYFIAAVFYLCAA